MKQILTTEQIQIEQLLTEIGNKQETALAELYQKCHKMVYAYALSLCRNPHMAEDILQDTFLKIYRHAGSYQAKGTPLAWILTITKNTVYAYFRKQKREIGLDDPAQQEEMENYYQQKIVDYRNQQQAVDSIILLKKALKELPPPQGEILFLHGIIGWKHKEIAQFLQLPLGTVLWQYRRAVQKLGGEIHEKGEILA